MLGPLVVSCVAAYFAYHATYGARGFFAVVRLSDEITETKVIRDTIGARKAELEARVALLKPESLDPDLLEERSRLLLDVGRPDDVIIFDRPTTESEQQRPRVTESRK